MTSQVPGNSAGVSGSVIVGLAEHCPHSASLLHSLSHVLQSLSPECLIIDKLVCLWWQTLKVYKHLLPGLFKLKPGTSICGQDGEKLLSTLFTEIPLHVLNLNLLSDYVLYKILLFIILFLKNYNMDYNFIL